MIAGWTQSHTNLAASSINDQVARTSVFDHEDHCLLHVMMTTSVFVVVIDSCCKVAKQLLFSAL